MTSMRVDMESPGASGRVRSTQDASGMVMGCKNNRWNAEKHVSNRIGTSSVYLWSNNRMSSCNGNVTSNWSRDRISCGIAAVESVATDHYERSFSQELRIRMIILCTDNVI